MSAGSHSEPTEISSPVSPTTRLQKKQKKQKKKMARIALLKLRLQMVVSKLISNDVNSKLDLYFDSLSRENL